MMNNDVYQMLVQREQVWFVNSKNEKNDINYNKQHIQGSRDPLANLPVSKLNSKQIIKEEKKQEKNMEEGNFPLRFVTFNVMQPCWLSNVYGKFKRLPGYSDRDIRAAKLCHFLDAYDFCCLQELNNDIVADKLKSFNLKGIDPQPDGKVAKVARSYHHVSTTGGLVSAVRHDIPIIWNFVYKFISIGDEVDLNRSASFTLMNMNNYWPGKYLLVCNVHLYEKNSHDDSIVREQQRGELFDQFAEIHKRLYPLGFKWEQCGVIVAGCFNVASENLANGDLSNEYRKLMNCLGTAHDLVAEVSPLAAEIKTFTTDENEYANKTRMNDTSRMDYIFSLDTIPSRHWNNDRHQQQLSTCICLPLKADYAEVLKDIIISDHYPVAAAISPRIKKNNIHISKFAIVGPFSR